MGIEELKLILGTITEISKDITTTIIAACFLNILAKAFKLFVS